ncbi:MAG: hypothetical protein IPJ69_05230 [Deltaproteobacteria bacterium]|nr:MAG: hypothetical protein IPJ69_05230 [Deltaproteobacteria bacterium]
MKIYKFLAILFALVSLTHFALARTPITISKGVVGGALPDFFGSTPTEKDSGSAISGNGGDTAVSGSGGSSGGISVLTGTAGDCSEIVSSFEGDLYFDTLYLLTTGYSPTYDSSDSRIVYGYAHFLTPDHGYSETLDVCYSAIQRDGLNVDRQINKQRFRFYGTSTFIFKMAENTEFTAHISMNDRNLANNQWSCTSFVYGCSGSTFNTDPARSYTGVCNVYDASVCPVR